MFGKTELNICLPVLISHPIILKTAFNLARVWFSRTNLILVVDKAAINRRKKEMYPRKVIQEERGKGILKYGKLILKKQKKNLGQQFINHRGKVIRGRQLKPGYNQTCIRKCFENLTEEIRTQIFTDFWALGDHNAQVQFVSRFVE